MTDVPEHLLQRSRDRRAALGLGGGGDAPAAASDSATPAVAEAASAPVPTAAAAPAAATPAVPEPEEPPPPYVAAALARKRMPVWVLPVIAFLPLWGWMYASTLSEPATTEPGQLELGAEIYTGNGCSGCHGAGGGGGTGRPLSDGEVLLTFPDIASQIEFVAIGSEGVGIGEPYGDPARPGGQHVSGETGANMPAFYENLSPEELLAVIRHEREVLAGEEIDPALIGPEGELLHESGEPWVVDEELVDADGQPLLDEEGKLANPPAGSGDATEVAAGG